jgi:hypothetical protein
LHRKKRRVLLIPDQWSGSVQEYYHFLLGYLAPLTLWLERHPREQVAVRDCGPMNVWFELLPTDCDRTIIMPGVMLQLFAGRYYRSKVLRRMDDPRRFSPKDLTRFREIFLAGVGVGVPSGSMSITVIDRLSSGAFNDTPAAEVPASGFAVRSTPNLTAVMNDFDSDHRINIIDAAERSPREQVAIFANTRVLIGQHGAGLTNMVWMPPGGDIVEILPPLPDYVSPIFANLAAACGHRHHRVPQATDHAPVDRSLLHAALTRALAEQDSTVYTRRPGKLHGHRAEL